jgi:hypothetical protein
MSESRREQVERLFKEIEQEAYARGYSDAIQAVTAAATAAATKQSAPKDIESPLATEGGDQINGAKTRGRPAKAITLVRAAIFAHPGMKGVELVRELEKQGTPVIERTVRSCLRRLGSEKVIWQREMRWYPKKKTEVEHGLGEGLATPPH